MASVKTSRSIKFTQSYQVVGSLLIVSEGHSNNLNTNLSPDNAELLVRYAEDNSAAKFPTSLPASAIGRFIDQGESIYAGCNVTGID